MPLTKGFKRLLESMEETYVGEPVPKKWRKKYGKTYDKEEVKSFAYAVAKSKGIKIDKGGK